jgi:hypothetical protein
MQGTPASDILGRSMGEQMGNKQGTDGEQTQASAETLQDGAQAAQIGEGNILPMPAADPPSDEEPCARTREIDVLAVTNRFISEGRWLGQLDLERDEMFKLARKQFTDKKQRQQWVYGELDRMYPPLDKPDKPAVAPAAKAPTDDGSIQGLGTIPEGWPELPANASLASEIGWVQANRLRIVSEQLGRATVVDLGKALSPAPSWAALGWLETSIRSYAKYVDVAAKATSVDEGEQGVTRRERMAIDEVKALLDDMEVET